MGPAARMGLVLLALAAVLTACGAEADSVSEEEQVAAVVNGMFAAIEAGDGEAACAAMTERGQGVWTRIVRRELAAGEDARSCEEAVAIAAENQQAPTGVEVVAADVTITSGGEDAEVRNEAGGILSLERVDDEWLVGVPAFVN